MTDRRKSILRNIMINAWADFRANGGRFATCLRAAWKREKRAMAYAKQFMAKAKANGGYVAFSGDLTRSATKRKLIGSPWAAQRAYEACKGRGAFGA